MSSLTKFFVIPTVFVAISVPARFVKANPDCYPFGFCDSGQEDAIRLWKITNKPDHIDNEPEWTEIVAPISTFIVFVLLSGVVLIFCLCRSQKCETEARTFETGNQAHWSTEVQTSAPNNLNDPPPSYRHANLGNHPSAFPALTDVCKNANEDPPSYTEVMGLTIANNSAHPNK